MITLSEHLVKHINDLEPSSKNSRFCLYTYDDLKRGTMVGVIFKGTDLDDSALRIFLDPYMLGAHWNAHMDCELLLKRKPDLYFDVRVYIKRIGVQKQFRALTDAAFSREELMNKLSADPNYRNIEYFNRSNKSKFTDYFEFNIH